MSDDNEFYLSGSSVADLFVKAFDKYVDGKNLIELEALKDIKGKAMVMNAEKCTNHNYANTDVYLIWVEYDSVDLYKNLTLSLRTAELQSRSEVELSKCETVDQALEVIGNVILEELVREFKIALRIA